MKHKQFLLSILLCLYSISFSSNKVIISEYYSGSSDEEGAYLELFNTGNEEADLNRFRLQTENSSYTFNPEAILPPGENCIIVYKKSGSPFSLNRLFPEILEADTSRIIYQSEINFTEIEKLTLENASGKTEDEFHCLHKTGKDTSLFRPRILFDEEDNILPAGSGFKTGSPTPLKSSLSIRRKQIMTFGYDNSGNRTLQEPNTIYLNRKEAGKDPQEKKEKLAGTEIIFFPNPVVEDVTVRLPECETPDYSIRLYDMESNLIYSRKPENTGDIIISMGSLPRGIFLLTVERKGETTAVKIIKE